MQTFLSEFTFAGSAAVLDNNPDGPRIIKQLLEGRQLLNALAGNQKGFVNHPACKMWRGHEGALFNYLSAVVDESLSRGIATSANWLVINTLMDDNLWYDNDTIPSWFQPGNERNRIIMTHRANLYKKDPVWYAQYENAAKFYDFMLATDPEGLVCCARRRRIPGKKGLHPCQYFWPTHMKEK